VRDHDGQAVTYVHCEADLGRRSVVTLFTRDEARHIADAVAKLPELCVRTESAAQLVTQAAGTKMQVLDQLAKS